MVGHNCSSSSSSTFQYTTPIVHTFRTLGTTDGSSFELLRIPIFITLAVLVMLGTCLDEWCVLVANDFDVAVVAAILERMGRNGMKVCRFCSLAFCVFL